MSGHIEAYVREASSEQLVEELIRRGWTRWVPISVDIEVPVTVASGNQCIVGPLQEKPKHKPPPQQFGGGSMVAPPRKKTKKP